MNEVELLAVLVKGFEGMSVYEAIDLQIQRVGLAQHTEEMILYQVTIYITILSAYLAAAYSIGARLSTSQAIIGSGLFTFAACFMVFNVWASVTSLQQQVWVNGMVYLAMAEAFGRPDWVVLGDGWIAASGYNRPDWFELMVVGPLAAGIFAALSFLLIQRRSGKR